jgi:dihydroorotate dehydrogenase (NAD+) catalytic subunit
MTDLSVRIGGLILKNPVITASGTFGYGTEFAGYFDAGRLGGIITKTVTLEPREGNPMPRIAETPAGMLNSIGLANVGVERFLSEKLPRLETLDTAVFVNVAGNTVDEYARVVRAVESHPAVDAIEINVSCPNVEKGGLAFGTDAKATAAVTAAVRGSTKKPVIVKLTPNVTDITEIARAAVSAGADGLSLINTVLGMAVDVETRRPLIARCTAGLSGPAIKPIALAKVYQVSKAVSVPLIGIGGIMTGSDAVEFLLAGATAVQTGTLQFIEPDGPLRVLAEIEQYCERHRVASVRELTGGMKA